MIYYGGVLKTSYLSLIAIEYISTVAYRKGTEKRITVRESSCRKILKTSKLFVMSLSQTTLTQIP